jgi:hypothetical protein
MDRHYCPFALVQKTWSVTPDNIVARLGPEYGNVLPSLCLRRV